MNTKKTKVSVIMAVYNGEKFLHESMKSILSQSLSSFEFLIVDDCSTDNTSNIILKYAKKDPRVRTFFNQKKVVRQKREMLPYLRQKEIMLPF
jgi:glycosyltransferase involved in cell wall biosynthesis